MFFVSPVETRTGMCISRLDQIRSLLQWRHLVLFQLAAQEPTIQLERVRMAVKDSNRTNPHTLAVVQSMLITWSALVMMAISDSKIKSEVRTLTMHKVKVMAMPI